MEWVLGIITTTLIAILSRKSNKEEIVKYYPAYWTNLVNKMRGDIPLPYAMEWLKVESDGNPCGTGGGIASNGKCLESGLAQLYYPSDYNRLSINIDSFRSYCKGGSYGASQVCIRRLTPDEEKEQVKALIDKINDNRSILYSLQGFNWPKSSPDYWSIVKLQHGMPQLLKRGWVEGSQVLGHSPSNWQEFKKACDSLNVSSGWIPWKKDKNGNTIYYSQKAISGVLENARKVGESVRLNKVGT